MNLYFLVEGRRTEKKVYPAWISHLVPELREVDFFDAVTSNSFFVFSGEGYPSLLDVHLPNALADITSVGKYDAFVIALDTDEDDVDSRVDDVYKRVENLGFSPENVTVIPQRVCIESWFLGNKTVVPSQPSSPKLVQFRRFYDVRESDPELMPNNGEFSTVQAFHYEYFREVANDRHFSYSKHRPGHVCDSSYVTQLESRLAESEGLTTLRHLFDFLLYVHSRLA